MAMQVADALARANRNNEEFALYDQLLRELAARAKGVPIGWNPQAEAQQPQPETPEGEKPATEFGRYGRTRTPAAPAPASTSRCWTSIFRAWRALNRPLDALRVYRTEIDRNPNDAGLYQRLGEFLEQNGMSRDVEEVYTKAIAKFADRSWYHKLARWYLRTGRNTARWKRSAATPSPCSPAAELEQYFREIVIPDAPGCRALPPVEPVRARTLSRRPGLRAQPARSLRAPGDLRCRGGREPAPPILVLRSAGLRSRVVRAAFAAGPAVSRDWRRSAPAIPESSTDSSTRRSPPIRRRSNLPPKRRHGSRISRPRLRRRALWPPPIRGGAISPPGRPRSTGRWRHSTLVTPKSPSHWPVTSNSADPRDPSILARMGDISPTANSSAGPAFSGSACPPRSRASRKPIWTPPPCIGITTATTMRCAGSPPRARSSATPRLFAYQAGAIYEGKRDYRRRRARVPGRRPPWRECRAAAG